MAFSVEKFSEYVNKIMKDGMSVHSKMYTLGQVSIIASLYNTLFTEFDSLDQAITIGDIDRFLRIILKENPDASGLIKKFMDRETEYVPENVVNMEELKKEPKKQNKKNLQGEGVVLEFKSTGKESNKGNGRTRKKPE
jgi:hypothetical protein